MIEELPDRERTSRARSSLSSPLHAQREVRSRDRTSRVGHPTWVALGLARRVNYAATTCQHERLSRNARAEETMKTRLAILTLLASAACAPHDESETIVLLGDPWNPGLATHYVVGTDVPLELTELYYPFGYDNAFFEIRTLAPCPDSECLPLEDLRIESTNPEAFAIDHTPEGPIGRTLAPGSAELVVWAKDEELTRAWVTIFEPERLEIWSETLDDRPDGSVRHATRVRRMAGGVLDLNARFFTDTRRVYGANLVEFSSDAPFELPTWAPTGNVVRITGDEVGVERMHARSAGLSTYVEVETVDAVDTLALLREPYAFVEPRADWSVVLPFARRDDERVFGSLPVEWEVDGEVVGVGAVLSCLKSPGASTVVARLGDVVARIAMEERCADTGIDPWYVDDLVD